MQYNLMGVWQEANTLYKSAPVQIRKANFNLNATQTFTLPKKWSVELSGFYSSADVAGLFILKPMGTVDVGIKKKMKDNKSTFLFSCGNVLETMVIRLRANVPEQNLYSEINLHFFYRDYKLTYTRNFGKEKLRGKRERTTGSEAERARVVD
jgi:hypothetical protein